MWHFHHRLRNKRSTVADIILTLALMLSASVAQGQDYFGTVSELPVVRKTISTDLSLDSLQNFVKQLTGELQVVVDGRPVSIPHRFAGNGSEEYRNAAQHIANIFGRYGLRPVLANNLEPYTTLNVIGTLPGRRAEYVIICGHFDSRSQEVPGADDNASGTSAVLEAARLLHGIPFEYTIRFIAFGGEELGLLGSKAYAAAQANDSIRAVINLDMIAWDGNSNRVVQVHSQTPTDSNRADDLHNLIVDVDEVYSIPTEVVQYRPGIRASDHSPFWDKGHPAVLLIEEFGNDFNPYYHSPDDNWAGIAGAKHQILFESITKLAVATVMHLAQPLDPALGIDALPKDAASPFITAYPNPANGRTTIIWRTPGTAPVNVFITDLLGRVVYHTVRQSDGSMNTASADLGGLPAGVYILRLAANGIHTTAKLIVR